MIQIPKQKHLGFTFGFLAGVFFTVLVWRFMEGFYMREVLEVRDRYLRPARDSAALDKDAVPARPGRGEQPQAPHVFRFDMPMKSSEMEGPSDAPVTITEFSDFYCPFCARVGPSLERLTKEFPGKIRRVFRHYPLPFHAGANRVHEASECAREQGKFWEFHQAAFMNQAGLRHPNALKKIAGLIQLKPQPFLACVESGKYRDKVQQDFKEGNQKGVKGTPSIWVNDFHISGAWPYEYFKKAAEHFLDPKKPLPEIPKPESEPPAPSKPVVFDDLKGKPLQGPEKAKVTIVEFSDFHCPFCARVIPTLKQLLAAHPKDVQLVWRHHPLSMHVGAPKTHMASECAAEQGKFWEYHDRLFENQDKLSQPDYLNQLAKELGLDGSRFDTCLKEEKTKDRIDKDLKKARESGVRGTPTFFINGKFLSGARPLADFEKAVSEELKKPSK